MYQQAATAIKEAEVFIITAGAGMGVDSGLPDFRGIKGFWNAYPAYERLGLSFEECANPIHFAKNPQFGWGFYGHRTNLYRETVPHKGFHIIKEWIRKNGADYFVVTSNVDGQFQKAGYDDEKIYEVHGSIHRLQCQQPCNENICENNWEFTIDQESMNAVSQLPVCPECLKIARPNILMFGDWSWISHRSGDQEKRFNRFVKENKGKRMVVIEIGAGCAIPTIRRASERLGVCGGCRVIRINPRESEICKPHISIANGALEGLQRINNAL